MAAGRPRAAAEGVVQAAVTTIHLYFQATNPMKIDSLSLSIPALAILTNLASR
jgi:hypothetical protein